MPLDFSVIQNLLYLMALAGVGGFIAEVIMQFMGQRAIEHQISMGIQAIIGVNNMQTIDKAMERHDKQ